MPRSRRTLRRRTGYTHAHVFQLAVGHDFFGDAFGRDTDAMRIAWPELREKVLTMHAERMTQGRTTRPRPWAADQFDKPQLRQKG